MKALTRAEKAKHNRNRDRWNREASQPNQDYQHRPQHKQSPINPNAEGGSGSNPDSLEKAKSPMGNMNVEAVVEGSLMRRDVRAIQQNLEDRKHTRTVDKGLVCGELSTRAGMFVRREIDEAIKKLDVTLTGPNNGREEKMGQQVLNKEDGVSGLKKKGQKPKAENGNYKRELGQKELREKLGQFLRKGLLNEQWS